jgi:hypothetical protein
MDIPDWPHDTFIAAIPQAQEVPQLVEGCTQQARLMQIIILGKTVKLGLNPEHRNDGGTADRIGLTEYEILVRDIKVLIGDRENDLLLGAFQQLQFREDGDRIILVGGGVVGLIRETGNYACLETKSHFLGKDLPQPFSVVTAALIKGYNVKFLVHSFGLQNPI